MSTDLVHYDRARQELAEAVKIDEVKTVRDKAEAIRLYAKQVGESLESQNQWAEIKLRAERRAGELLKVMEKAKGGRPTEKTGDSVSLVSQPDQDPPKLEDLGISRKQSSRWQAAADVPEEVFEEHVEEVKSSGKELTSAGVQRIAQEEKRKRRIVEAESGEAPIKDEKYRVIYADPPWKYGNDGVIGESDNYGIASRHYPTMSIEELCAMPIKKLAEENSVLFMWVTSPLLAECWPVITAWGFKYKSSFVWDKVGHNYGHYNSVRHELLLVCTRGSCLPDSKKLIDSVQSIEKSRKHSEKPEEFRKIIDTLYSSGKRIELFARKESSDDWVVWGNESSSS